MPIDLFLEISSLFQQDNVEVENIQAPIEVINVSKLGIGFLSKSLLPIGFYFNAKLILGNSDSALHCVLRILRSLEAENGFYEYGSEFIGMAPILDFIFEDYEKYIDSEHLIDEQQ